MTRRGGSSTPSSDADRPAQRPARRRLVRLRRRSPGPARHPRRPLREGGNRVRGGLRRGERTAARRSSTSRRSFPRTGASSATATSNARSSSASCASPPSSPTPSRCVSSASASAARIRSTRSSRSSPSATPAFSSSGPIAHTCGVGSTSAQRDGSASGRAASCGRTPSRCPRTRRLHYRAEALGFS